ncbi:uncharacterized protein FIBRA_05943 [Fibroporia radiculosa]|uniref:Methionine aminopeptidase 2 n=1 Tax=Fibroporia radiculosa TaxID=599839 RepID=J4GRW7_9APHY|nr:uncharacterized protein FIBRA_05943 [Fibroporia radiculosa]CCM03795.1 predicted protein [Fibroporia radiculosa]
MISVPNEKEIPQDDPAVDDDHEEPEEDDVADALAAGGDSKKKKKKKKPKKKKVEQTEPPRVALSKIFPSGNYPEGELQEYKNDNSWRTSSKEMRLKEQMEMEDPETTYNHIRKGAEVHRQVRKFARKYIKPGMSLTEIAEVIEDGTRALVEANGFEAGVGFPTGLNLNHCAAHFSPNAGDTVVLQHGDVMKVDFGVHVKGRILDSAFTLAFGNEYDKLLEAVKAATDTGIREAGIDVRLGELGGYIQETMESYEVEVNGKVYPVKAIANLSGHSILPYQIHGSKAVPLVRTEDQTKMEEGEYFAIETFGSTGRGRVVESGDCSHYARVPEPPRVPLRLTSAKSLLNTINKNFGTIPFCRRYLDRIGESKYLLALNHLVAQGIVNDYPPLCDAPGSMTAQFEHTILLRPTRKEVLLFAPPALTDPRNVLRIDLRARHERGMTWPFSLFWSGDEGPGLSTSKRTSTRAKNITSPPAHLLVHFGGPGGPLPPSARVGDPTLKQRQPNPLNLWQLGRLGAFAAMKASVLILDLISHHLWGPRRKSWGVEMTLLSSIMRDVGRHSHLGDMALIRMLMGIGGYLPLPSDALVTPVTFRVRRRKLRGILAEFDAVEDGARELSGEWVVGKRTWQRLQREWRATRANSRDRDTSSSRPTSQLPKNQSRKMERVVLYLHGGAYYVSSAASHRLITIPLAKHLDSRLFAIDYRLAPETRFPGPLHDVVSAYFRLVDDLHIPPENIIVAGDSAGGGLSLALLLYLRDNQYPLPAAAILMSPWVDLTMSCDTWDSNAEFDIVPRPIPGDHLNPIACYLGDNMNQYLTHPYASPLFGNLEGFPPLLIQGGECEVLRDEITLLAHKATLASVELAFRLGWQVHVFQSLPFLEAARSAFASSRDFVHNFLPRWESRSPKGLQYSTEKSLEKEIDSDAARIVRGDGQESHSRQDFEAVLDGRHVEEREKSHARKKEESPPVFGEEEEPSWVSQWPTPPETDEEVDGASIVEAEKSVQSQAGEAIRTKHPPPMLRLRSTVSLIADASYRSASGYFETASMHQLLSPPGEESLTAPISRQQFRGSTLSISSYASAPKPSIRRSDRSHPDIRSLVQEYAKSGPAHHTLTFKPEDSPRCGRSRTASITN